MPRLRERILRRTDLVRAPMSVEKVQSITYTFGSFQDEIVLEFMDGTSKVWTGVQSLILDDVVVKASKLETVKRIKTIYVDFDSPVNGQLNNDTEAVFFG